MESLTVFDGPKELYIESCAVATLVVALAGQTLYTSLIALRIDQQMTLLHYAVSAALAAITQAFQQSSGYYRQVLMVV